MANEGTEWNLYEDGPAAGSHAPILLTHFDGAMDAGGAGGLAVSQMLRSLDSRRVATFDSDLLVDYRSHRPLVTVEDWVTTDIEMPEIALDLVHDDLGHPILLLHGPEPDAKWEAFAQAVSDIAHEAGVEISFSLHGIPSGVPHTRPTPVHVQATDASLIPEQPQLAGIMQFPAPMTTFLQERLSTTGIEGVALLASVPYYMSENAYPGAASALLGRLSSLADLSLPVGDLERGASEDLGEVSKLIAGNSEVAGTIEALERHYDAMSGGGDPESTPTLPEGVWDESSTGDIGDVIEAYLANVAKREKGLEGEDEDDEVDPDTGDRAETVADVLERLRRHDSGGDGPATPRHRAD